MRRKGGRCARRPRLEAVSSEQISELSRYAVHIDFYASNSLTRWVDDDGLDSVSFASGIIFCVGLWDDRSGGRMKRIGSLETCLSQQDRTTICLDIPSVEIS